MIRTFWSSVRRDRRRVLAFAVVYGLCIAVAFAKAPILSPDSASYVSGDVARPAMIPLVFQVLRKLVPLSMALRAFDALQAALAVPSCALLARTLARRFELAPLPALVLGAVLSIPQLQAVTSVLSESLACSFLYAFVGCALPLLDGDRALRFVFGAAASSLLLVLTRAQFVFLVPLVVTMAAYYLVTGGTWLGRARLAAGLLLILGIGLGLQAAHTYPKLGRLSGVSGSGTQAMVVAISLSSEEDVNAIVDGRARDFATRARHLARDSGLLVEQATVNPPPRHFEEVYNQIQYHVIPEAYFGHVARTAAAPSYQDLVELDRLASIAARGIVERSWLRFVQFGLGEIWYWERTTLLVGGLLALGLFCRSSDRASSRLLLFLCALWISNDCLIVTFEPPLVRYTFYFDTLLIAVTFALVARSLRALCPTPNPSERGELRGTLGTAPRATEAVNNAGAIDTALNHPH